MEFKRTILIIEDDLDQQTLYKITLQRAGYNTIARPDAITGLAWLEQVLPDMIVLDIMLPQISGVQMLAKIRETANGRYIPIIIVTASGIPLSEVAPFQVNVVLRKPILPQTLIETINKILT